MGRVSVDGQDGTKEHNQHNLRITKPLPEQHKNKTSPAVKTGHEKGIEKTGLEKGKKRKCVDLFPLEPVVQLTDCCNENIHDENVCTGCKKSKTDIDVSVEESTSDIKSNRRHHVQEALAKLLNLRKISEDKKIEIKERLQHTCQAVETGRIYIGEYFNSLRQVLQEREDSLNRKLKRLEIFSLNDEAINKIESAVCEMDGLLQEGTQLLHYSPSKLPVITDAFLNRVEKQLRVFEESSHLLGQGNTVQLNVVYPYLQLNIVYPFDLRACLCNFGQIKMKYTGNDSADPVKVSFQDLPTVPYPVIDSSQSILAVNSTQPSTRNSQVCISHSDNNLSSDTGETLPTILNVQTLAKGAQDDNTDEIQHSEAIFLDANGEAVQVTVDNYGKSSHKVRSDGRSDSLKFHSKKHLNGLKLISSQKQLIKTTTVSVQTISPKKRAKVGRNQVNQCDSTTGNLALENSRSNGSKKKQSKLPAKGQPRGKFDRIVHNSKSYNSTKKQMSNKQKKHAKESNIDKSKKSKSTSDVDTSNEKLKKSKSASQINATKRSKSTNDKNATNQKLQRSKSTNDVDTTHDKSKKLKSTTDRDATNDMHLSSWKHADGKVETDLKQQRLSSSKIARKESGDHNSLYRRRRDGITTIELKKCDCIMTALWAAEDSWPFVLPVNRKEVPDYYDLIKDPIDLTNIRDKIDTLKYNSAYDFAKDMLLLFTNCESYNMTDAETYQQGKHLQEIFCSLWEEELPDYKYKKVKFN